MPQRQRCGDWAAKIAFASTSLLQQCRSGNAAEIPLQRAGLGLQRASTVPQRQRCGDASVAGLMCLMAQCFNSAAAATLRRCRQGRGGDCGVAASTVPQRQRCGDSESTMPPALRARLQQCRSGNAAEMPPATPGSSARWGFNSAAAATLRRCGPQAEAAFEFLASTVPQRQRCGDDSPSRQHSRQG